MDVIQKESYFDQGIFDAEVEAIFKKEWLLAGLTTSIKNKRDWLTIELFGQSIILYNTGAEIKAFQNVCPHRFNKIFTEPAGNGPMLCTYHLWAFNENGEVIGKKNVTPEPQSAPCLKTYPIEVVGSFIFINLLASPQHTLQAQLGAEIIDELRYYSEVIFENVYEVDMEHNCNWKFIVENTIELHHCAALHKNTLLRAGICAVAPSAQNTLNRNSFFILPVASKEMDKKRSYITNALFGKDRIVPMYKHTFIYPNTLIGNIEGVNIHIGTLVPVSPDKTMFKMHYFLARPDSDNEALFSEFKRISKDFSLKVFGEDKAVLERVQEGVKQIEHNGYQYTSEQRVGWFVAAYNNSMNNNGIN